jgi:hypothetical protein
MPTLAAARTGRNHGCPMASLTLKAPHPPHAALLYLDWLHSTEGSTDDPEGREDTGSFAQKFKESSIDEKYGLEEAENKFCRVGQVDAATVCQRK